VSVCLCRFVVVRSFVRSFERTFDAVRSFVLSSFRRSFVPSSFRRSFVVSVFIHASVFVVVDDQDGQTDELSNGRTNERMSKRMNAKLLCNESANTHSNNERWDRAVETFWRGREWERLEANAAA